LVFVPTTRFFVSSASVLVLLLVFQTAANETASEACAALPPQSAAEPVPPI